MDGANAGPTLSHGYSGYLAKITPDDSTDANQQLNYPTSSFPWSCEGGNCNCSAADIMAEEQSSLCANILPSTTDSSISTESDSYVNYPYSPPTDSNAIAAQQIKEGLCPLATGASSECVPQLCGANPPCQAFWNAPEIEECTEVPCLIKPEVQSSLSLREPSSPRRQSSPSPAKRIRRDAGKTRSSSNSGSEKDRSTMEKPDTKSSPKHDKKPKALMDSKQAHSLVEKRYRENLNAKISELHGVLSSAPDGSSAAESCQTRKSEVLQTAIDYVNQSQLEMRHMTNDINRLNARVQALEKLVKCEGCTLYKGFDGLSVMERQGLNGMNGIGAPYDVAARSAG